MPRPLAGTYSKVEMPRPPTTAWVPSGSCALVAYHRPFCNGTSVSTQLQSPSPAHGLRVLICGSHHTSTNCSWKSVLRPPIIHGPAIHMGCSRMSSATISRLQISDHCNFFFLKLWLLILFLDVWSNEFSLVKSRENKSEIRQGGNSLDSPARCSTIGGKKGNYLGKSIVVSTGLYECAVGIELPRGTPGVGLNKERPNGVGTEVEDGRVSCAVVSWALLSQTRQFAEFGTSLEISRSTRWSFSLKFGIKLERTDWIHAKGTQDLNFPYVLRSSWVIFVARESVSSYRTLELTTQRIDQD